MKYNMKDTFKNDCALSNYYNNYNQTNSRQQQIQRIKSSENMQIIRDQKPKTKQTKKPFIEPGTPCQKFEEILSSTCVQEEGMKTYFIAKALSGPALQFASQECNKKQPAKKPSKKIPEIPKGISDGLQPHLEGYATTTHAGLYRKSNEDKITIYLQDNSKWFSIYDGHGGNKCSQFLKERLHEIFFNSEWRKDIPTALRNSFLRAEEEWSKKGDDSGSCALVVFIHRNICYTANLGDSRAVLVSENQRKCYQVTKDHKPSNQDQQKRIIKAGGKIYQTTAITHTQEGGYDCIVGPLRVFPGRLSMTRSFGDFEAKDGKGPKSKIVICEPEVTSFQIDDHDILIMGSDGLWDKVDNKEAVEIMRNLRTGDLTSEGWYKKGTEALLEEAMSRGSTDNISIVMVGLNDPWVEREPRKGNQNIKILSSLGSQKKKTNSNKENSHPEKAKDIDCKISQINSNASLILQQSRRA